MPSVRAAAAVVAAGVLADVLAGCGLSLGGSPPSTRTAAPAAAAAAPTATARLRATVASAQRTHEIPTPSPAQKALGGWRSPVQAVQVFAQNYINWTADTVAMDLHVLSQAAVGQARSAMKIGRAHV